MFSSKQWNTPHPNQADQTFLSFFLFIVVIFDYLVIEYSAFLDYLVLYPIGLKLYVN